MTTTGIVRYFSNLEYLWDEYTFGPNLQTKRNLLTVFSYLLLSLGLFSRQITGYPSVEMRPEKVKWSILIASFLIGLALFPPIMRRLNLKRRKPSWEHALVAFSIGFFIDLSSNTVIIPLWNSIQKYFR
jgi:hypothetical protein